MSFKKHIYYLFILALMSCRPSSEDLLEAALYHMDHKNYKNVVDITGQILRYDSLNPHVFNLRGLAFLELQNLDESINCYNYSIFLDSFNYLTYHQRGKAYYQIGSIPKSIDDMNQALSLMKEDAELYFQRGTILLNIQEYKKAIKDFRKALEFDPDNPNIHFNLAEAKFKLEDYSGAERNYRKAISLDKNLIKAYHGLGLCLIQQNKKESGCIVLLKAKGAGNKNAIKTYYKHCDN
ncbi:MAG: tetratricopeptide repeat protein [Cytophagaceae bacterium]